MIALLRSNNKQLLSATITPLASIFGSGFLVIVPILAGAVGDSEQPSTREHSCSTD